MVRMLSCFLLMIALPALAAPAYRVEPASVALGEPLKLSITARPDLLENLDLAPLGRDFEMRDQTQGGDAREASLSLTLYPLHTGRIVLPRLGLPMRAPSVAVLEQSDKVPKVRFRFETEPQEYHVREAVRLTIEACDDGSLMWQRPLLPTTEGLFMRALNEEQVEVEREGERCTAHRWHWSIQPAAAGEIPLSLPMLEANKFGLQLRFPPPPVTLAPLPVPNWLPADAAVGEPQVSAAALPAEWQLARPLAWRIEVNGGYSAEALKNLLRLQLGNRAEFTDYPPTVEELPGDSGRPRYALALFAVFSRRGEAKLPDLVLPWFDTASGEVRQLRVQGARVRIVDPARQRLFAWLAGLAGLLALSALAYLAWRGLAWRLRRLRALSGLKQAGDAEALARLLCAFSLQGNASPAATLGEWQRRMQREAETEGLGQMVEALQAARYGSAKTEIAALRAAALACLASARPRPSARARA